MAKSQQEEERLRQEKLELLKMKQGIIEESEIIPEDAPTQYEKPHGWKKVSNFFYQNKWFLIPAFFAAALLVFLAVQFFTREKADIEIIVAVTTEKSELLGKIDVIEETLEMYCPDFDGNGKVHVSVETIDLSMGDTMTQYADVERQKFSTEIKMFDRPLAVCDKGYISDFIPPCDEGYGYELYSNLSGTFSADILYNGKSVICSKTGLDFASDALLCVRALPANSKAQDKNVIERRERALIVLQNIVEGNVVNPK